MRKILLTIILTASISQLKAQCIRAISTNPVNPSNPYIEGLMAEMDPHDDPQDPSFNPLELPVTINPWLNSFNWARRVSTQFADIELSPNVTWQVPNLTGPIFNMKPLYEPSSSGYIYLYPPPNGTINDADFHWEDGWELLWLGTGYYPNGEEISTENPSRVTPFAANASNDLNVPYIILYNRYRGTMRLFIGLFTEMGAYDNATVELRFPIEFQNLSGTLRHINNYDQALDKPTSARFMSSQQEFPSDPTQWFSADFQMAYDPCVCDYSSNFEIEVWGTDVIDISLSGRAVSLELPLTDDQGNSTYDNEFLSVHNLNQVQESGGNVIYHKAEGLIEDYQERLEKYNQDLKDYNAAQNNALIEKALPAIITFVTKGTVPYGKVAAFLSVLGGNMGLTKPDNSQTVSAQDLAFMANFLGLPQLPPFTNGQQFDDGKTITDIRLNGDEVTFNEYKYATLQKSLEKEGPKILASGFDFLNMQIFGGKPKKPVKPTTPTATYTEMKFVGNITDKDNIATLGPFLMPGGPEPASYSAFNYPAYNEALGLYALLESPEFFYEQHNLFEASDGSKWEIYIPNTVKDYPPVSSGLPQDEKVFHNGFYIDEKLAFKLNKPLKYYLNNALDIDYENSQIFAQVEVVLSSFNDYNPELPSEVVENFWYDDNLKFFNEISGNLYLSHAFRGDPDLKEFHPEFAAHTKIFHSKWHDLKDFGERYFQLDMRSGWKDFLTHRQHPFIPAHQMGYLLEHKLESIKLKIIVDLSFEQLGSEGEPVKTSQVFTYNLYDESTGINELEINSELRNNRPYYPGTIVLGDENLDASSSKIHEVNGNEFYVKAERIEVKGNVTIPQGKNLILEAFEEVKVFSSSSLPKNAIARINKNPYNFPTINEQTSAQVRAFCSDQANGYKANTTPVLTKQENPSLPLVTADDVERESPNKLSIYPNPASEAIKIEFSQSSEFVEVKLNDLNGRTYLNQRVDGELTKAFELDFQDLAVGVYILQMRNAEGQFFTERVVKK